MSPLAQVSCKATREGMTSRCWDGIAISIVDFVLRFGRLRDRRGLTVLRCSVAGDSGACRTESRVEACAVQKFTTESLEFSPRRAVDGNCEAVVKQGRDEGPAISGRRTSEKAATLPSWRGEDEGGARPVRVPLVCTEEAAECAAAAAAAARRFAAGGS